MMREPDGQDIGTLWRDQPAAEFRLAPADMQRAIRRIDAQTRRLGIIIAVITVAEIAFFGVALYTFSNVVVRIGSALIILAMIYIGLQVRAHRAGALSAAEVMTSAPSADAYRSALEQQRDFYRGMWFWSRFAALVPGIYVFCLGAWLSNPATGPTDLGIVAFHTVALAAGIVMNRRRAHAFQRQIDDVKRLTS